MSTSLDCKAVPAQNAPKVVLKQEEPFLADKDGYAIKCMTDCEEAVNESTGPLYEQTDFDADVDITECTGDSDLGLPEADDPDATDNSSSFADTLSDSEICSELGEAEVESHYYNDNGLGPGFDSFSSFYQLRNKKLTSHWKRFIRPLMWRCKWTELRIREIESQKLKYSREIEELDKRKASFIDPTLVKGCGSRSLPCISQSYPTKVAKRRKRKRVEDTTDIATYMSNHNLFSYVENRRCNEEGFTLADDFASEVTDHHSDPKDTFVIDDSLLPIEFKSNDESLEQLLRKIELVYSQVRKLRSRVDILMSENVTKFSSSENLSLLAPYDAHSPTFSAANGDAMYNPSQNISGYDIGDIALPDSTMSSYGEAFHVPDIIESTVGLLSGGDVTFQQQQPMTSRDNMVDRKRLYEVAEETRHTFMSTTHQTTEKHHEGEEGESIVTPSLVPSSEYDNDVKPTLLLEQSTLESCLPSDIHIPRNKRKRGERKAGSWAKKHSGDPDSH